MCLSKLFGSKPAPAPTLPPPPPAPSPPPTPTAVDSGPNQQDALAKRRKQLRAGLASTIKTRSGGVFGGGAELSSVTSGKSTLG